MAACSPSCTWSLYHTLPGVGDVGQQLVEADLSKRVGVRISTKKLVESGRVMLI